MISAKEGALSKSYKAQQLVLFIVTMIKTFPSSFSAYANHLSVLFDKSNELNLKFRNDGIGCVSCAS